MYKVNNSARSLSRVLSGLSSWHERWCWRLLSAEEPMIASHLKGIISVHLAIPYYQPCKDKAIIRFLLFIHKVSQSVVTFCQCQELAWKNFPFIPVILSRILGDYNQCIYTGRKKANKLQYNLVHREFKLTIYPICVFMSLIWGFGFQIFSWWHANLVNSALGASRNVTFITALQSNDHCYFYRWDSRF